MSGVQLQKKQTVDKAGKEPKFTATFTGSIEGFSATITLEAETERDMRNRIPLIFDKLLEIKIIDPQTIIDDFQEPKESAIYEEFILGRPEEIDFISGVCMECGVEMWRDPDDDKPICVSCKELIESEQAKEQKKERLQKIAEDLVLRAPGESPEAYEERKQRIENEKFRAERKARMEAQV